MITKRVAAAKLVPARARQPQRCRRQEQAGAASRPAARSALTEFMNSAEGVRRMWALGVMVYEMLKGEKPYAEGNVCVLRTKIAKTEPPVGKLDPGPAMVKDPKERLKAKECRGLPWFSPALHDPAVDKDTTSKSKALTGSVNMSYFKRAAMLCMATELSMPRSRAGRLL